MLRPNTWACAATALVISLTACGGNDSRSGQTANSAPPEQTVQTRDSTLVRENAVLQAQKDSLFGATRSLLTAIASIDSATALAGVKPKDTGEPITAYEEGVRQRTLSALRRLRTTQAQLRTISARVASLSGANGDMKAQIDTFRTTVTALQAQLTMQARRGDSLSRQLYAATLHGDSLAYRTRQLTYTIDSTNYENHRVFAIAGTKNYLMKHGIVEQVGGTRFPFIVRLGSTVRPANVHPDTTLFTRLDMTTVQMIPVDTSKTYEVVSAQDLSATDRSDAKGRVFRGPIRITDPQRFWRASPYLILVQR